ncbi:MAG: OmpA family protein, partial [Gammaproteobacteria bacterium]|nr:OmpA family protein [Gammaproteobacteria bacterium]
MAVEDPPPEDDNPPAGWIMTFADLMSLLMCFFVLLLSFSEMDVQKYKQVAGSMKFAFGVQREVKANDRVKGTSIIFQEYSPGRPEQTLEKVMRQQTTDETQENIVTHKTSVEGESGGGGEGEEPGVSDTVSEDEADNMAKRIANDAQLQQLLFALKDEILEGAVQIELYGDMPLIKVQEKSAFPSGKADLDPEFLPVLDKIANAIINPESRLIVSGHTDDVPIKTARYPSNWILSAARAASVVDGLKE